jgi:hypothetical protein
MAHGVDAHVVERFEIIALEWRFPRHRKSATYRYLPVALAAEVILILFGRPHGNNFTSARVNKSNMHTVSTNYFFILLKLLHAKYAY